ncbi:MAG: hypothetical protein RR291_04985, partial [Clostridia bacterium]
KLAEKGYKILVIEKCSEETIGKRLDIFHMAKKEFSTYDLPLPKTGDIDWAFEFCDSQALSPTGKYPKKTKSEVVGMHMHEYILRLNKWAIQVGAQIEYEATLTDLLYDSDNRVCGVRYVKDGRAIDKYAKLVADCSGIPAVARTMLKDNYGVENFKLTDNDMFYVILKYFKYNDPKDYIQGSRGWTYYKTWEAPQQDPQGAILGVGANFSYEYAEKIYAEFERNVALPDRTLQRIERGFTPYCRPPYSLVGDGFIAMGDSACLTKPFNGEGVSSSMVESAIAVTVVDDILRNNKAMSCENLWSINNSYINAQGAKFASMMATILGAVNTSAKENEFFFRKDIVFSAKSFESMDSPEGMVFSKREIFDMAIKMIGGVLSGNLRIKTIKSLLKGMSNSDKIKAHYLSFPTTPQGYDEWARKADEIWKSIGTMADCANNNT